MVIGTFEGQAISLSRPPRSLQVHEIRAADEELQAIVIEPDPEPVADQAGGEDLAQGEAAGAGDSDYNLLEVGGASLEKLLQMRAFGLDAGAAAGIVPADNLIDEGAIHHKIVEVPAVSTRRFRFSLGWPPSGARAIAHWAT